MRRFAQIVIVCGPTATGKTRYRRQKYASGYVVVDAVDIFISLSRGKYIDFPSFLEEPMETIGTAVARRAIQERRKIVTEVIGHEPEPFKQLIDAMTSIGYKVELDAVVKDPIEAWKWNLQRSDDNISAFYIPTPTATDDSGTATVTTSPVSGAVFPVGTTTVDVTATDAAGNTATGSFTVTVLHNFSGFLQPVDELPTLNVVGAGQAVPVKFSLSGNKGLNIFAAGYPASGQIACDANELGLEIEVTVSAGGSSLSYDATADRYTYVWKTEKAWKGTCRILALRLTDGRDHFAKFRFR